MALSREHQDELVLFEKTGGQDCANAIEPQDFLEYMRDHPKATADQVLAGVWKQYEDDGLEVETIAQMDIPTGLTAAQCYRWWSNGWKGRAHGYVKAWHAKFQRALKDELQENPAPSPDLEEALGHARRLVAILEEAGIKARAWGQPGVGARVYLGTGYLAVSRGGDVKETMRGQQIFEVRMLHQSYRPKYRLAIQAYRDQTDKLMDDELEG